MPLSRMVLHEKVLVTLYFSSTTSDGMSLPSLDSFFLSSTATVIFEWHTAEAIAEKVIKEERKHYVS